MTKLLLAASVVIVASGSPGLQAQEPSLPLDWTLHVETHAGGCYGCDRGYRLRITSDGAIAYADGQLDKSGASIDSLLSHDETWGIFWMLSEMNFLFLDHRYGRFDLHATSMSLTFSVLDREHTVDISESACDRTIPPPAELCALEAKVDTIARRLMKRQRPNKR